MEQMSYRFPAADPAAQHALAGIVSSGDLEVLLEPNTAGTTTIVVNTSVKGRNHIWNALLSRIFTANALPAARVEINDCGATPGVVRMRIEQAFEEAKSQ